MSELLQMITGPDSKSPSSSDLSDVDERSDAELDALPFGVIGLDDAGTILRYNLYESRLARLDRNQVLGRDFFTEVAPCTRTEAFEGRFRAFVSGPPDAPPVRFEYLFDFKFGAQEVSVELLRAPGTQRFYLLVGRRKIAPPRADFPVERLAALQRDLAPDEPAQGVLRDDLERRFIGAPAVLFAALRATCDKLAPETWELFATEWGVQWGRRAAVDLEATALEAGQSSVRELSMREAADRVSAYFAERGWGAVTFDFAPAAEGIILAQLHRSALAEAAPRLRRDAARGGDLACHLLAGSLAGILSSLAGRRLAAREVACVAGGAPCCSIVVVSHDRRETVDAALADGQRGLAPIRLALRRGGRASR